ncbi:hypothetical protein EV421DRAFT_1733853 [Armillaria borealis]|uniref:Uncharacterized protein n=1 Tax=Armillaria borealis TaxID=47425 RepID=A0AA39JR79_9AGAR|nr:hypothetical protein EV421DRAFT_1733853 [Armillaria borealis]
MSQPNPDFASVQKIATQYSDSWFNEVIIESLTHVSTSTIHRVQVKILAGISVFMYIMVHDALCHEMVLYEADIHNQWRDRRNMAPRPHRPGDAWWSLMGHGNHRNCYLEVLDYLGKKLEGHRPSLYMHPMQNRHPMTQVFGVFLIFQELDPLKDSQVTSINWGMAYYIMALPTMVICTMLIVYHLAKAGMTSKSLRFIRNRCYNVIEILVESSALPYNMYPQAVLDSVTDIG